MHQSGTAIGGWTPACALQHALCPPRLAVPAGEPGQVGCSTARARAAVDVRKLCSIEEDEVLKVRVSLRLRQGRVRSQVRKVNVVTAVMALRREDNG